MTTPIPADPPAVNVRLRQDPFTVAWRHRGEEHWVLHELGQFPRVAPPEMWPVLDDEWAQLQVKDGTTAVTFWVGAEKVTIPFVVMDAPRPIPKPTRPFGPDGWVLTRVRVHTAQDRFMAQEPFCEGVVIGWTDRPTITVVEDDGRQSNWITDLPILVLEREARVPERVDPWTRLQLVRELCQGIVDDLDAQPLPESLDEYSEGTETAEKNAVRYLLATRVLQLLDGRA